MTFDFTFDPLYRAMALPFGITPDRCRVDVDVDGGRFDARFGFWRLTTGLDNIAGAEVSGPYRRYTTIGPAHLSLSDRGMTCATNRWQGLCITFREPVRGIDPLGRLRHPGLTVTVADVEGLRKAITAAG